MKNIEIEMKWDANMPRAFARAQAFVRQMGKAVTVQELHIRDFYLDHPTRELAARKIALRVRNTDGKWEATFKTRTKIVNGKAVRREETLPLKGVRRLPQALQVLEQKKQWEKINLCGLEESFRLVNRRTCYGFNYGGATLEMACDRVTICICGRQVKLREIEVELKKGSADALHAFCRQMRQHTQLKPAKISKVKTAETLRKWWKS